MTNEDMKQIESWKNWARHSMERKGTTTACVESYDWKGTDYRLNYGSCGEFIISTRPTGTTKWEMNLATDEQAMEFHRGWVLSLEAHNESLGNERGNIAAVNRIFAELCRARDEDDDVSMDRYMMELKSIPNAHAILIKLVEELSGPEDLN